MILDDAGEEAERIDLTRFQTTEQIHELVVEKGFVASPPAEAADEGEGAGSAPDAQAAASSQKDEV